MDIIIANESCSNVTLHQMEVAALTRGVTGLICFVLCVITLVSELVFICRLRTTNTLQRLYLYLTVSTMFYMGVLSLHIEHYFRDYAHRNTFCIVIGALDQYTGSVQLLFTLGITFVLFHKLFSMCGPYGYVASKFKADGHHKRVRRGYCLEVCLCVVSTALPLLVIWIPFQNAKGGYGSSGPWCWIESKDPTTCDDILRGVLEQVLLWYAPFGLIAIISFLCIVCVLTFFCYLRFRRNYLVQRTQAVIKEMMLLMVFLGIFCVVSIVESITRGILNIPKVDIFALWMVYAIITPIGGMAVPIGFFVYFLCSKHLAPSALSSSQDVSVHAYSNMRTGNAGDRLIHNPSRVSQPSHTSDRDSQFFLSKSGEETSSYAQNQPLLTSTSTRSSYLSVVEKT